MDESPQQLLGETRVPCPAAPGRKARYDTQYERLGTANLFMFVAPRTGWRRVEVTERRTRTDWAHQIKRLADEDFPTADKIVLVMDNLNTHTWGSLYETFSPQEAARLRDRFEVHYTPKHGSWLNMAEIEFSVLNWQALAGRIASIKLLLDRVEAWRAERNREQRKINWQFTTADARIKLKHLYPTL
jgi:hypothetical protein